LAAAVLSESNLLSFRWRSQRNLLEPSIGVFSPSRILRELRSPVSREREPSTDRAEADRLIERYLNNKKMIEAVGDASVYHFDWRRHQMNGRAHPQPLPGVDLGPNLPPDAVHR
jgi:hypothetical protein